MFIKYSTTISYFHLQLFVKSEFNEQLRVCELISPPIVQRHENGYFLGKKVDTSISIFLDPK
ncbi:hypothetical protein CON32_17635 [Bacillus cereus]|nr:hypothetical protein CON32_17635 [Bacillus cereus]